MICWTLNLEKVIFDVWTMWLSCASIDFFLIKTDINMQNQGTEE